MQTLLHLAITIVFVWTLSSCNSRKVYDHDVGYINPSDAIVPEGFTPCDTNVFLQYYNAYPHAGFKGGKKLLREKVMKAFNKINEDNGYITFRFVINCRGEAGYFIVHHDDLNLVPAKLSKELETHLFNIILQELKEWSPLVHDGKRYDSYMYLKFKIVNGEITEILP